MLIDVVCDTGDGGEMELKVRELFREVIVWCQFLPVAHFFFDFLFHFCIADVRVLVVRATPRGCSRSYTSKSSLHLRTP